MPLALFSRVDVVKFGAGRCGPKRSDAADAVISHTRLRHDVAH